MSLRLYDTATRSVRDFVPLVPGQVGVYHCGLTVQGAPHVGHLRKEVVFDVLRRWLERSGLRVTIIANVTDIDDKILTKSADAGAAWWAWAYANERALHDAYAVLGCIPPTYEPRATGHIPEMVELMDVLVERGHAYAAEDGSGDVYFDVLSWPPYGELSGQKVQEMEPAADADPRGKRDPRDFALWKGHKEGEPLSASWPAPYGRGRPGWHLECSAMAAKYLGAEFDIHGGGIDLRFPHHENEQAQSHAAGLPFARFWMHNAWITTSGEKMSKSLGNSLLVSEVVKRVRPVELRYYLVASHYRSHVEFSFEALAEAGAAYRRVEAFLARADRLDGGGRTASDVPEAFAAAMDDDLGVPQALAVLFDVVRAGNAAVDAGDAAAAHAALGEVHAMLSVLGLDPADEPWATGAGGEEGVLRGALDALVQDDLARRQQARAERDFVTADAVRDRLTAAGVVVEDTPDGPRWALSPAAPGASSHPEES